MQNLASILLTVFGIIIFIALLPTLLWLLLIVVVVIVIYVSIQKMKYRKYMDNVEDEYTNQQNEYYTNNTSTQHSDDVIDVEFSESEDES